MPNQSPRGELLALLCQKSVFFGDFTLASGAKSTFYFDCRLTTLDPKGASLLGPIMLDVIQLEAAARKIKIDAVGGLTMGADPVAFAIGLASYRVSDRDYLQVFSIRKSAKSHGQTKLVEGNFAKGQTVVIVEDVVTRGDSAIAAIDAVLNEGGRVGFVVALVDRQEGGREKIEALGYPLFAIFTRDELLNAAR